MKTNGREDSGRFGIVLGSDVVLKVDPQASFSAAVDELTTEAIDTNRRTDQSVVVSTARSSERALLALVDGRRTVQELVRLAGMSDLVVRRHLRALCERGILVPAGAAATPSPPESPSDSAIPEPTAAPGSGGVPAESSAEGLSISRALAAYLDSGKTGVVQTPASDAVTAKAATPTAEGSGSRTLLMGGAAADRSNRGGVVKAAADSGSPSSGPPASAPDAGGGAGRRVPSPPAGVVTGEWPPRSNTPPSFKPNVTAFWIPSASSEPPANALANPASGASGGGNSGSPAGAGAGATGAPRPAPADSSAASPASPASPAAVSPSPATTMMWPKPADGVLKSGRPRSPAQGNVIVTVGAPPPAATPAAPPVEPKPAAPAMEAAPTQAAALAGSRSKNAAIPFRLGEYEVATRIAQGGMGSIYVCRRAGSTGVQRLFTLKVVRQHAKQVAQVVQSFRREARVGALLSHPNLQTVIHVGTYHEQPFLILDYVEGIGLAELLATHKRLPPAIVVSILVDVLRGLKAAHDLVDEQGNRLGLVHGDISPQNILIGVDGNARLTDFGSARFSSDARVADVAPLVGKPAFMAPEQLSAEPLDARTDLFSLGVLMWTALTGQPLFVADSYEQIVMNVFRKKIPPPSEFGAPACFDEISTTALSRSPEGRYSNAEEMANALSRVARAEGIVGSPYDVGQWVRREFAETLAERRRRVQVVFGGVGTAVAPAGPASVGGAPVPAAGDAIPSERPGATTADGYPRLPSRTVQIAAIPRRRSTPRLRSLDSESESEEPVLRWTRRRVVAVSAAVSFPFALALAYLATNPIARRIRQAHAAVPAAVSGEGVSAPAGGADFPPSGSSAAMEAREGQARAPRPAAEMMPPPSGNGAAPPVGVTTTAAGAPAPDERAPPPTANAAAAAQALPAEPAAPTAGAAPPVPPAGAPRAEPR